MDSSNSKELISKYIEYVKDKSKHGFNPVTALDYSSLYPSLIMTYNLSPEYLITDENYKNRMEEKGYPIHEIDFVYNYEDAYQNQRSKTIKGWTIRHEESKKDSRFGLYPEILKNLFSMRAEMKKSLEKYKDIKEHMEKQFAEDKVSSEDISNNKEYQDCLFNLNYCDTKQKALKVYMNCFYGELGNKNSPLFILELAGGITSAGQSNLRKVKKFIEDNGCKTYYGDSVHGDTPIIVKNNKEEVMVMTSEELHNYASKLKSGVKMNSEKDVIDSSNTSIDETLYVKTEKGWSKILKYISHETNKNMYRVTTHFGSVIVTEDHSLLDKYSNIVKPGDCKIGTELLHWNSNDRDTNNIYLEFDSQIEAQTYFIKQLEGHNNISVDFRNNKYVLSSNKVIDFGIKKIEQIEQSKEIIVYDLETESHHFAAGVGRLVVHNTDSLYFTFHDDKFIDIHKQYFLTTYDKKLLKQDYCTELVNRTFKLVKEMAVRVNEFLNKDNGTKYLKMAYEEVLFPVVFLSRKKYYGIAHEKIVNFKPKNIFIRGLEVKKRGVSEILRIICLETMWESMDIYNFKTLREMVMAKIDYLYSKEWKMEEFIQTGLWKPNKKNQTLIRYIERVIAEGRDPPDAYERFNYVIVKIKDPARLYDFKGRKIDIKKGDKMEYVDYAEKNNMEIDLDYYFEKQLTGQFARLISYDEEFHVYNNEEWKEDEEMEIEDVKTMRLCRKFIKEYASKWSSGYSDMANVYREIFRSANKFINNSKNSIISKDKQLGVMMMDMYESHLRTDTISIDYRQIIELRAINMLEASCVKKSVTHNAKAIVKDLKTKKANTTKLFSQKYTSFHMKMKKIMQIEKEKKTMEYIKFVKDNGLEEYIFMSSEDTLKPVIKNIRSEIDLDNLAQYSGETIDKFVEEGMKAHNISIEDDEEFRKNMKSAYSMFLDIVSIYKNIKLYEEIQEENINAATGKTKTKFIPGFRL